MPRRLVGLLLVVVALTSPAACSRSGQLTRLAEEVAAATGASVDDVLRRAEQEAGSSGSSTDDIVRQWRRTIAVGAGRELQTYRDVPEEVRSLTCDTVTDVLADYLDGDATTDPSPLQSALDAVAGLNPTAGADALGRDLTEAKAKLDDGEPATLALLVVRTGACAVLAS